MQTDLTVSQYANYHVNVKTKLSANLLFEILQFYLLKSRFEKAENQLPQENVKIQRRFM